MRCSPFAQLTLPVFLASLALPAGAQEAEKTKDIVAVASGAGKFKTLLAAAEAAGLVDTLKGEGPLTVFAPTDAAFSKLPEGTVEKLLQDREKLTAILTYHVVPGRIRAADLEGKPWLKTVQGQVIHVSLDDEGASVDGARVETANVEASNGVIHIIDSVILPRQDIVQTAVDAGSFKTLVAAVKAAKLVETLQGPGPFTVFAPNDPAFDALPEGTVASLLKDLPKLKSILTYHVVSGRVLAEDLPVAKKGGVSARPETVQGGKLTIVRDAEGNVTVDGAKVVAANILCGNGIIHIIDKVIVPGEAAAPTRRR